MRLLLVLSKSFLRVLKQFIIWSFFWNTTAGNDFKISTIILIINDTNHSLFSSHCLHSCLEMPQGHMNNWNVYLSVKYVLFYNESDQ